MTRLGCMGLALVAAAGLISLIGCEESYSEEEDAAVVEAEPKVEQSAQGTTTSQGGGQALGGAKRAATNVIGDVQERSNQSLDDLELDE